MALCKSRSYFGQSQNHLALRAISRWGKLLCVFENAPRAGGHTISLESVFLAEKTAALQGCPPQLAPCISVGPPSQWKMAEKDIFDDCLLAIFNNLITYMYTGDMPPWHHMASFKKEASNIRHCSFCLSFTKNYDFFFCLIFFGNLFEVIPVKLGVFPLPFNSLNFFALTKQSIF